MAAAGRSGNATAKGHDNNHRTPALKAALELAIERHQSRALPLLERWWRYYRNEGRGRSMGQVEGLPPRLKGRRNAAIDDRIANTRELVIENDIAWRVHTMVDFMFGRPFRLRSTASDEALRRRIEAALDAVWEASGGIALLQDMGLLGHVFGHVDLVLRADATALALLRESGGENPLRLGEALRIDVIDPRRGIPVLDEGDYRLLRAYAIRAEIESDDRGEQSTTIMEVYEPWSRRVERDGVVVHTEEQRLFGGQIPVVHVQNVSQPFRYSGLGEIEPLVPLQDELNTRLSDRASRVTMQCFKMYLARGLDGFEKMPVGPGQLWSTDNPDASIEAFGGDASSPSEEAHIKEVREAMDKVSSVPPLATGVVQGRVGNLSSANALRITLVGLLAKTARKRVSYGRGIAAMSDLVLRALDASGVMPTDAADRGVRLEWPDPLPEDTLERTLAAKRKMELGVPAEEVLDELGYSNRDQGVV